MEKKKEGIRRRRRRKDLKGEERGGEDESREIKGCRGRHVCRMAFN